MGGDIIRSTIDLADTNSVGSDILFKGIAELPVISNSMIGRKYKYLYSLNSTNRNAPYNQIIKLNLENKELSFWQEKGCFPSEVSFIKSPNSSLEDDGLIMCFVTDIKHSSSFILILNAQNFKEIARIIIPDVIPFGSHGQFFS